MQSQSRVEWVRKFINLDHDSDDEVESGAVRLGDKVFTGKSLRLLKTHNLLRRKAIDLVVHPWFDGLVLFLIFVNSIFIAVDDPLQPDGTVLKHIAEVSDTFFLVGFTLESLIKIIAMGLVLGKHAYLRDPWNVVDFFIVCSGLVTEMLNGVSFLSLIRIVRVFRPLRSINRIAGMRRLVNTLFSCLPLMLDVVLLSLLIFYLFSLVGVVLWTSHLHTRCWWDETPRGANAKGPQPFDTLNVTDEGSWGPVCSNTSVIEYFRAGCSDGGECIDGAPSPYPHANFDNIAFAMILVFQCVTLDGWIIHSYAIEDGWSPLASLFFVFLTMFGAYFFANLVLAVVTDALSKLTAEESLKKEPLTTAALTQFEQGGGENTEGSEQSSATHTHRQLPPAGRSPLKPAHRSMFDREGLRGTQPLAQESWQNFVNRLSEQAARGLDNIQTSRGQRRRSYTLRSGEDTPEVSPIHNMGRRSSSAVIPLLAAARGCPAARCRSSSPLANVYSSPAPPLVWDSSKHEINTKVARLFAKRAAVAAGLISVAHAVHTARGNNPLQPRRPSFVPMFAGGWPSGSQDPPSGPKSRRDRSSSVASGISVASSVPMSQITAQSQLGDHPGIRHHMRQVTRTPVFRHTITAIILLNAFLMAIEHYDMSDDLVSFLDYANFIITFIFLAECLFKVLAYGPRRWSKDTFNLFDALVVTISLVELGFFESKAVSLFRVFRMFRVLRFLKLARSWKVLHQIIEMISSSLSYMGYLILLIMLFIFIFGVLGRSLLAGQLTAPTWCQDMDRATCVATSDCEWRVPLTEVIIDARGTYEAYYFANGSEVLLVNENNNGSGPAYWDDPDVPGEFACRVRRNWSNFDNSYRASFDSLFWSMVHVFQIMTRDSWSLLCYRLMDEFNVGIVFYFLIILVFGAYLLFSMFIAILLVKLSEQSEDEREKMRQKQIKKEQKEYQRMKLRQATKDNANKLYRITAPGSIDGRFETAEDGSYAGSPTMSYAMSPRAFPASPANGENPQQVSRSEVLLYHMERNKKRKERLARRKKMKYEDRVKERRDSVVSASPLGGVLGVLSERSVGGKSPSFGDVLSDADAVSDTTSVRTGAANLKSALKKGRNRRMSVASSAGMGGKRAMFREGSTLSAGLFSSAPVEREQNGEQGISFIPDNKRETMDLLFLEAGADRCFAEDEEDSEEEWEQLEGKSFFVFPAHSRFRLWLTDLLLGRFFEVVISYLIIANCVVIAFNDKALGNDRTAILAFRVTDWVFTVIFSLEILARFVVHGAVLGDNSYLRRSKWNRLDCLIVVVSLLTIPAEIQVRQSGSGKYFATATRFVKAMRAFRPLRILVRTKRMKVVIGAFINTIPAVFNVLAVAFVLYFIFGIGGVQLMAGAFRRCSDGSDRDKTECVGMWNATEDDRVYLTGDDLDRGYVELEREWINPRNVNFDNLYNAWCTLIELAALSGWMDVMYSAVDSSDDVDGRPERNRRPILVLYFIAWIFAGAFFVMNIFTGVVVDHFSRQKLKLDGSVWLTEGQERSLRVKRIILNARAKKRRAMPPHPNEFNKFCHRVVSTKLFPKFILACIVGNVVLMATIHHDMSADAQNTQTSGNMAFTFIFTVEMILEMGVSGPKSYLNFKWFRLDFFVVCVSWLEIGIAMVTTGGGTAAAIQLLRLARAFRLLRHFKGLRKLLMTLYYSIPAFYNITSLLLLMFFIFSILGMALFEDVRIEKREDIFPIFLSEKANFSNFPRAMFTLYRVATMDSWARVVTGCLIREPYCSEEDGNCGNAVAASLFFSVFMLCIGFVMMNLFIAIILENFRESVLLPDDLTKKMEHVTLFREMWASYDPQGLQYILASQFVPLLQELLPPIGLYGREQREVLAALQKIDFPITWPEQQVLFADAIDAIGESVFEIQLIDSIACRSYLKTSSRMELYKHGFTISEWYACSVIQTGWRQYRLGQPLTANFKFVPPSENKLMMVVAAAVRSKRNDRAKVETAVHRVMRKQGKTGSVLIRKDSGALQRHGSLDASEKFRQEYMKELGGISRDATLNSSLFNSSKDSQTRRKGSLAALVRAETGETHGLTRKAPVNGSDCPRATAYSEPRNGSDDFDDDGSEDSAVLSCSGSFTVLWDPPQLDRARPKRNPAPPGGACPHAASTCLAVLAAAAAAAAAAKLRSFAAKPRAPALCNSVSSVPSARLPTSPSSGTGGGRFGLALFANARPHSLGELESPFLLSPSTAAPGAAYPHSLQPSPKGSLYRLFPREPLSGGENTDGSSAGGAGVNPPLSLWKKSGGSLARGTAASPHVPRLFGSSTSDGAGSAAGGNGSNSNGNNNNNTTTADGGKKTGHAAGNSNGTGQNNNSNSTGGTPRGLWGCAPQPAATEGGPAPAGWLGDGQGSLDGSRAASFRSGRPTLSDFVFPAPASGGGSSGGKKPSKTQPTFDGIHTAGTLSTRPFSPAEGGVERPAAPAPEAAPPPKKLGDRQSPAALLLAAKGKAQLARGDSLRADDQSQQQQQLLQLASPRGSFRGPAQRGSSGVSLGRNLPGSSASFASESLSGGLAGLIDHEHGLMRDSVGDVLSPRPPAPKAAQQLQLRSQASTQSVSPTGHSTPGGFPPLLVSPRSPAVGSPRAPHHPLLNRRSSSSAASNSPFPTAARQPPPHTTHNRLSNGVSSMVTPPKARTSAAYRSSLL